MLKLEVVSLYFVFSMLKDCFGVVVSKAKKELIEE
jgi:hypothetical protein